MFQKVKITLLGTQFLQVEIEDRRKPAQFLI